MDRQLLKRLTKGFQLVFTLAVIYVVGRFIVDQWQEISQIEFTFNPIRFIVALVLLLLFYLLYVFSWMRLIGWSTGRTSDTSAMQLAEIFFTSLLTRYLPAGKIVNIGSRIELYKRGGGRRSIAVKSIIVEQFYLIGCALMLAWITILFIPDLLLPQEISPFRILLLLGGGVVLVLLASADVIFIMVAKQFKVKKLSELDFHFSWQQRLEIICRYLTINVLQGSAAFFFLTSIFHDSVFSLKLFMYTVAAYPVSRFLGQMIVFIPGGIGVREGLFAIALSPYFPVPAVLLAGTVMRLSSVVIEILMILLAFFVNRKERVLASFSG